MKGIDDNVPYVEEDSQDKAKDKFERYCDVENIRKKNRYFLPFLE